MCTMQGDEYVHVGIAPPDTSWYLRFYETWDDEGQEMIGRFDFTLSVEMANLFRESVVPELDFSVIEQAADEYYKKIIV